MSYIVFLDHSSLPRLLLLVQCSTYGSTFVSVDSFASLVEDSNSVLWYSFMKFLLFYFTGLYIL